LQNKLCRPWDWDKLIENKLKIIKKNNVEIKRTRAKLKIIKQHKLWLEDKIENQQNFNKRVKEKIRNQNNGDRIGKTNIWQIVI
jgi:hypothetical protein